MQQSIHIESKGSLIFVKPTVLYVSVDDIVKFYADDAIEYDVVIPNKDKFFVSTDGATIEETVTQTTNPVTPAVNGKPVGTEKYYSVSTSGGGMPYAPPKIIIIS